MENNIAAIILESIRPELSRLVEEAVLSAPLAFDIFAAQTAGESAACYPKFAFHICTSVHTVISIRLSSTAAIQLS